MQIFSRYEPDASNAAYLQSADPDTIRLSVDRENRCMIVEASFGAPIPHEKLHALEEDIKETYDLRMLEIRPTYPSEYFSEASIPELLDETCRRGTVARGFFDHCRWELTDSRLSIEIPFAKSGVELVNYAKTPKVIEAIAQERYGVALEVLVTQLELPEESYYAELDEQLTELEKSAANAEAAYLSAQQVRQTSAAPSQEESMLPRAASIYRTEDPTPVIEGKRCRIGHYQYDLSEPEYVLGETFDITPTPIAFINHPQRNLVLLGEALNFKKDPSKDGEHFDVSFDLFDGNASIGYREFGMAPEEANALESALKSSAVAIRGSVRKLTRKGTVDPDFSLFYKDIAKIKRVLRTDKSEKKRVELHLHTTMSAMDAVMMPEAALDAAMKWGHPAVAITDHGNVQAFPEAMTYLDGLKKKNGGVAPDIKVLYGMEAYFVNNTAGAITGVFDPSFDAPAIVFDIETTGLSVKNCGITEIGAVKIQCGEVLESFDTFVNPEMPIPEEIQSLTGITNEMVKDAPKVKEALEAFFAFIGGEDAEKKPLLIAHNANFDIGFIRYYAEQSGLAFPNPYLDTLALSKYVNPELKNHKLDTLVEAYGLGDFNHHRASEDSRVLALIYFQMLDRLKKMEVHDLTALQRDMTEKADPLKLKPYHQILLVKNQTGLKNLYRLVSESYLRYFKRFPRIPKTVLEKYREGLIVGSACEAGELFRAILENRPESEIEEIVEFYDYLEIQPICNNRFLVAEGSVKDDEGLRDLNRTIVSLGEKYHKPVCATCDAHFLNREDELYRKILLAGQKYKDYDRDVGLYFRTTEEMLEEFSYLGEEKAYEVVVTNPNLIADQIEAVRPIPKGSYPPSMEGAEEELENLCWTRAREQYGDPLPELVSSRLERELGSIIKNGFAVLYLIAQRLVHFSEEQGYLVGSRGSVGSSFVANMAGISEVNPLPPHYFCPQCKHTEFFTDGSVGSGFDLPTKKCPVCGATYKADGQDIMFETFLGFEGEKSPDIDLNFSGEVQGRVHKYTEDLFGEGHVFRAGTISALADKTAYGYVAKYVEQLGFSLPRAEMNRLVSGCLGVKKTTGQHPGGIIVVPQAFDVYDFTPIQHPADDPNSDVITTHFAFSYLHDTILKLDELGHDIPTKYKWLERFTDSSVLDVAMNDKSVYDLLESTTPLGITPGQIDGCTIGTYGLPELGTNFVQQTLLDAKPHTFADLLKISGLTHGTNVWLGNAQDLIKSKTCDIRGVIGCRDDVMADLIRAGVPKKTAFQIMEAVRKGKGLTPEWEATMLECGVPSWYIDSCKKIKYLFPKAHAAAYVMSAIRLGWYKVHEPVAFYCTMFTVAPNGFDAQLIRGDKPAVEGMMHEIIKKGKDASQKETSYLSVLQLVNEAMARGIRFLPVDLEKSHAFAFLPENGAIRMPFSSLPGLGENAAQNIIHAREEEPFFSVEDLQIRAKLGKTVIEMLRQNGVLDHISETNQLTMRF